MGTNFVEVVDGAVSFHPQQVLGVVVVAVAAAVGVGCAAFIVWKMAGWVFRKWAGLGFW